MLVVLMCGRGRQQANEKQRLSRQKEHPEPLSVSHVRHERVECVEANNSLGLLSKSRSRSRLRESGRLIN